MRISLLVFITIFISGILYSQNYQAFYTGNAKGDNINGQETFTYSKSSGTVTKVEITRGNIKNYTIENNSQTINNFNFTYSTTPTSTVQNDDSYGNTYTVATFDSPPNTINMISNYNGETNVTIPNFVASDVYPIPSGSIPSNIQRYLEATSTIQSGNATISTKALTLVSSHHKLSDAIEVLAQWIKANISYRAGGSQDALYVYNNKSGNCSGFTNLMIAFLRSVDIPARYVSSFLLNKSYQMPIWGGNYMTLGSSGPGTHAIYHVYFPSLAEWVAGDPQIFLNYIDTNNIKRAHGKDKSECYETIRVWYSGSPPNISVSLSINTTISSINPCNYNYTTYQTFTGTLSGNMLFSVDRTDPTGIEDYIYGPNGPNIVEHDQIYTYDATFYDYPPATSIYWDDFELYLYHTNGIIQLDYIL